MTGLPTTDAPANQIEGTDMTTNTPHHPIAIIGAGLGGLTMAAVLYANGITAPLFELEAGRNVRTQGGMLDIHDDTGQKALQAAGLFDQFTKLVHVGGESQRVLDHHGTVLFENKEVDGFTRPEIDRGHLRDLLLDALPDGAVHWGCRVIAVRPLEEPVGRHEVTLANGQSFTTDLLVGADGAWSKVRALVSDALPAYTGISFIEGDLEEADERHPDQAVVMGPGMLFALGGGAGIIGHRETDGSLHFYLGHHAEEGWIDSVDFTDTEAGKAAALGVLDGWAPELRGLVANADAALTPRRIHALPPIHTWDRTPGVTLLGDAAHLMSPFAGEGANLAMYDGYQLAFAIAANPGDTEKAVAEYEAELFPRAQVSATDSADSLVTLFSDGAAQTLATTFDGYYRQR
jgi:2-polyprenyl-6-methoxyphenol hydroxylase-like FAD-dependent oxidoreductase